MAPFLRSIYPFVIAINRHITGEGILNPPMFRVPWPKQPPSHRLRPHVSAHTLLNGLAFNCLGGFDLPRQIRPGIEENCDPLGPFGVGSKESRGMFLKVPEGWLLRPPAPPPRLVLIPETSRRARIFPKMNLAVFAYLNRVACI